jgi:hypothetical protein
MTRTEFFTLVERALRLRHVPFDLPGRWACASLVAKAGA